MKHSEAYKLARLQQQHETTLAMLRVMSNPIVLLVAGCVAAEAAEKTGMLSEGWAHTIQGAMLGMAVASAIKEAGAVGGVMAGVGAAGGAMSALGTKEKVIAALGGPVGQALAVGSSLAG